MCTPGNAPDDVVGFNVGASTDVLEPGRVGVLEVVLDDNTGGKRDTDDDVERPTLVVLVGSIVD